MAVSNVCHAVITKWRVWFGGYVSKLEQTFVTRNRTHSTKRNRGCPKMLHLSMFGDYAKLWVVCGLISASKLPELHITRAKDSSTQKPAAAVLLLQTVDIPTTMSHVSPCACQQGWAAGHCWVSDLCEILLSLSQWHDAKLFGVFDRNQPDCNSCSTRRSNTQPLPRRRLLSIRSTFHSLSAHEQILFKLTPVRKVTGRSYRDGCPEEILENIK
jgi:hypothetical protein